MEVLLFIIGACLGSFYLVVGKRLPINEDILFSRSRCDKCKKNLKWYDLIPIFSYVFLVFFTKHLYQYPSIFYHSSIEILFVFCYLLGFVYFSFL